MMAAEVYKKIEKKIVNMKEREELWKSRYRDVAKEIKELVELNSKQIKAMEQAVEKTQARMDAVEKMVKRNQHHEILLIEGQGSLVHPSYSGVTLSLLHGAAPQAMILCYEIGRDTVSGLEHLKIPPLKKMRELNETMASIFWPCRVIGVSMISRLVDAQAAEAERTRVQRELGVPVCDVIRHGPQVLVNAILQFQSQDGWRKLDIGVPEAGGP